jgi:glycyl-tRNA synthetase beta chain
MPALLLEVGCEELPATFVRKAYSDLHGALAAALSDAFGGSFSGRAMGTPRRLIVAFDGVPTRQDDAVKEVRGPALKAAFDEAGNPTGALQGFCRSNGAEVGQLRRDDQYVWFDKPVPGRAADEVLAELLPKVIKGLNFEKSMRWGSGRLRFARPIRWLLAALDGHVVRFEIEGVESGSKSRGHRTYAPEEFEALTFDQLVDGLRKRKVEPDPAVREAMIRDEISSRTQAGHVAELPSALVEENVFLVEWPSAVLGEFRAEHLELPEPVLTTAMAKHERMFPVRDGAGKLTTQFIFIRNSGEDETVRRGAEWVLNARLDDAQFFFREDMKRLKEGGLDYFLEKTSGIVFQEKLGTVRERADRLAKLAKFIFGKFKTPAKTAESRVGLSAVESAELAAEAARLAKFDLSTGLVSDMASLQGIVAASYYERVRAGKADFSEAVQAALESQYEQPEAEASFRRTRASVMLADNLDKLAGYLTLGLAPSGSSDPFGLRRAAGVCLEVATVWPELAVDLDESFNYALELYSAPAAARIAAMEQFQETLRTRYTAQNEDVAFDVLRAATGDARVTTPWIVQGRISVLSLLARDTKFIQTATRPVNLVSAAKSKHNWQPETSDPKAFAAYTAKANASAAVPLMERFAEVLPGAQEAFGTSDFAAVAQALKSLEPAINGFLDETMIMVDDDGERDARLTLLSLIANFIALYIGDVTQIVIDG